MANDKPKRIWDNYRELFEIQKSDRIKFVIAAATRDGFRYINVREFYFKKKDSEWKPGRDGITIPVTYPINGGEKLLHPAERLLKAITKACEYAEAMELADPDNEVWYYPKEEAK